MSEITTEYILMDPINACLGKRFIGTPKFGSSISPESKFVAYFFGSAQDGKTAVSELNSGTAIDDISVTRLTQDIPTVEFVPPTALADQDEDTYIAIAMPTMTVQKTYYMVVGIKDKNSKK